MFKKWGKGIKKFIIFQILIYKKLEIQLIK